MCFPSDGMGWGRGGMGWDGMGTFVFLVLYLIFILIQESGYIFDQGSDDYIKRDF